MQASSSTRNVESPTQRIRGFGCSWELSRVYAGVRTRGFGRSHQVEGKMPVVYVNTQPFAK